MSLPMVLVKGRKGLQGCIFRATIGTCAYLEMGRVSS